MNIASRQVPRRIASVTAPATPVPPEGTSGTATPPRCAKAFLRGVGVLLACAPLPLAAQDRADDNAIKSAEDGFGSTVGREAIGIYTSGNTRGFSPTAAGNVRLDGLYFDPRAPLASTVYSSSTVKVGLSAQGYPFTAPSGIVDYSLRRPGDKASASVVFNADAMGSAGIEAEGSVPVSSTLSLGYGLALNRNQFYDGTSDYSHSEAIVARWHPSANVEIMPFWMLFNDYDNETGLLLSPAGAFLPPQPRAGHYDGPDWADYRNITSNAGVIATASPARDWTIRVGAFRSVFQQITAFNDLLENVQPDGTGDQVIIANPPTRAVSLSGEIRLAHSIADGPRHHLFYVSVRERDAQREFGGSDVIDLGPARIGVPSMAPLPAFTFTPLSRSHVKQTTYGVAYDGRWDHIGELSFGISRATYAKTTTAPDVAPVTTRAEPLLYNGTLAIDITRTLVVYAGYTRGLEESGSAPTNAANRSEPLPAIVTEQKDAGARLIIGRLKAVAGLFELTRPYFSIGTANRYHQTGTTRARGAEFSLSGAVTDRLNIVAAGNFLDARVEQGADATTSIGRRPVGLPLNTLSLNADWRIPGLRGISIDGSVAQSGNIVGTTDNMVVIPARDQIGIGGRYRFKMRDRGAVLRVQLSNILDDRTLASAGPGLYNQNSGRSLSGYLAIDF